VTALRPAPARTVYRASELPALQASLGFPLLIEHFFQKVLAKSGYGNNLLSNGQLTGKQSELQGVQTIVNYRVFRQKAVEVQQFGKKLVVYDMRLNETCRNEEVPTSQCLTKG